ncbi:MAG: hypothetical protein O3A51_05950 [Verrucomicrobia bacterium]|nr:hypothetical protein [Verrucomicrobiota bacterium]
MIFALLTGGEPTMPFLLVLFAISTTALVFVANKLSVYCDALEQNSNVSAIWIGGILLAVVTSLPEAVTTLGAALMKGAMDLGPATLFGSNAFNLLIIVLLDVVQGRGPLLRGVQSGMILIAGGGIMMTFLAAGGIALHQLDIVIRHEIWLGPLCSVLIVLAYVLLGRLTTADLAITETSVAETTNRKRTTSTHTTNALIGRILCFALLLVLISVWLLQICDRMATTPFAFRGQTLLLGHTVTGTFLLSAATSFPELFVSIAALRLGQTNMAIANVLGSNMVNMLFLSFMHTATRSTTFYSLVDAPSIMVLAGVAISMTLVFVVGLRIRSQRSFLLLGWDAIAMLGFYVCGAALVIKLGLQL